MLLASSPNIFSSNGKQWCKHICPLPTNRGSWYLITECFSLFHQKPVCALGKKQAKPHIHVSEQGYHISFSVATDNTLPVCLSVAFSSERSVCSCVLKDVCLFHLFFFISSYLFSTFCHLAGFVLVAEQCALRAKINIQLNFILRCLICILVLYHCVSEIKIYLLFLWHKPLFVSYLLSLAPQVS